MRENSFLAITLPIVGWVLTIATTFVLLSGNFDTRTCQTTCVNIIFWLAVAAGVAGLLVGLMNLSSNSKSTLARLSVLLSIPLCGIFIALILIGEFA